MTTEGPVLLAGWDSLRSVTAGSLDTLLHPSTSCVGIADSTSLAVGRFSLHMPHHTLDCTPDHSHQCSRAGLVHLGTFIYSHVGHREKNKTAYVNRMYLHKTTEIQNISYPKLFLMCFLNRKNTKHLFATYNNTQCIAASVNLSTTSRSNRFATPFY